MNNGLAVEWGRRILEEFRLQVELEASAGLPLTVVSSDDMETTMKGQHFFASKVGVKAFGVGCLVFGFWCQVSGVRCLVSGVLFVCLLLALVLRLVSEKGWRVFFPNVGVVVGVGAGVCVCW